MDASETARFRGASLAALWHRRQFFLGPYLPPILEGWQRQRIADDYYLCAHPDLELTHVGDDLRSLTLLGFILDPEFPEASNSEILNGLLRDFSTTDLPSLTERYGGRWAIVALDDGQVTMFHDATGMRQIYYCINRSESGLDVFCGSQPRLLADIIGLTPDSRAVDYVNSRGNDDCEVYWLPGDSSPYSEIRALLPNHQLEFASGKIRRYWPNEGIRPLDYQEVVNESLRELRGLVRAARHRYPLSVAMTAGWDSRLMLALTAEFTKNIHLFTLVYPGGEDSRDVRVPAALLKKLGLQHHLIRCTEQIDSSFREISRRNSSSVQEAYCPDVQAMSSGFPADRLCVTGDAAEIVKNYYAHSGVNISAQQLAELSKIGDHPFGIEALDAWLSNSKDKAKHINLLDLFCWEQMAGRWQAHIRAEYDIVQESFAPLNCRKLLVTMLGAEPTLRKAPQFELLRKIIETSWKDVLTVPINPPEKKSWKYRLIQLLIRFRVYQLIPKYVKNAGKRALRGHAPSK